MKRDYKLLYEYMESLGIDHPMKDEWFDDIEKTMGYQFWVLRKYRDAWFHAMYTSLGLGKLNAWLNKIFPKGGR